MIETFDDGTTVEYGIATIRWEGDEEYEVIFVPDNDWYPDSPLKYSCDEECCGPYYSDQDAFDDNVFFYGEMKVGKHFDGYEVVSVRYE